MAISTTLATSILNKCFGREDFTPPETWYFGLCTQEPVNGELVEGSEPKSSSGYARYAIENNPESFTEVDGSSDPLTGRIAKIANANTIQMNEITSGEEPEVTHFFLADSATNSESGSRSVWIWGKFERPRKLVISSNLVIEPEGAVFNIINVKS